MMTSPKISTELPRRLSKEVVSVPVMCGTEIKMLAIIKIGARCFCDNEIDAQKYLPQPRGVQVYMSERSQSSLDKILNMLDWHIRQCLKKFSKF